MCTFYTEDRTKGCYTAILMSSSLLPKRFPMPNTKKTCNINQQREEITRNGYGTPKVQVKCVPQLRNASELNNFQVQLPNHKMTCILLSTELHFKLRIECSTRPPRNHQKYHYARIFKPRFHLRPPYKTGINGRSE